MRKREIIKIVNSVQLWEKNSKLLDLLVQDGRLPKHNRINTYSVKEVDGVINTYSVKVADGVYMIYYNRDAVVIVNQIEDTSEVMDFKIYCQDPNDNDIANRRR